MKTAVTIVVLVIIVGGIYYLNGVARREDGKSLLHVAPVVDILVDTVPITQRDFIRQTVQAPGEVEALEEVDISSEVVAKILEMPVKEGDLVQQGQLLCRLDDADYRARVLSREAGVAKLRSLIIQSEADLQIAERDWAQAQRLRETDAISEMELANYKTALIKARALVDMRQQELIEAEAILQSAREDLAKTVITAPISGTISQLFAEQGEVVVTGTMNNPGTRIMVISNMAQMQVRCRIDEADAPLVAAGQPARIYLQSDTRRSIPGEVLRVGAKGTKQVGRDVVTFETLVLITGDDPRVRPGMTANVEIEVARRENVLTVPVQAVVHRKRRDLPADIVSAYDAGRPGADGEQRRAEYLRAVFCIRDDVAHVRLVETGISDVEGVEIVSGLAPGEVVVTGPYRSLDQLKEGSRIKINKPPAETPLADAAAPQPTTAPAAVSQPATQESQPGAGDTTPAERA